MVEDRKNFKYEFQEELVINRYNRQELVNGWNQNKLANSSIAILGSGSLANYVSVALTALGIGNLELYDNTRVNGNHNEFLLNLANAGYGDSKVECLEQILSKINPSVLVKGVHTKIDRQILAGLIGQPNLVIDLTNYLESKKTLLE